MALQKCKECGNQVSSSAENCPKCGAPVKKKRMKVGCLGLIIILFVLGLIGIMLGECEKESEKTKKVAQEVKKKNRDEKKEERIQQEQAKRAENEQEAFNTHIEEHYQRLVYAFQNKNYYEVDEVFKLFKDNNKLKYKDVETINNKATIARLDEEVRPIPASQVEDNLRIYRKLAVLDPNNPKYQKKVAYYSKKLEEKQRNSLGGSTREIKQDDTPASPKADTPPLAVPEPVYDPIQKWGKEKVATAQKIMTLANQDCRIYEEDTHLVVEMQMYVTDPNQRLGYVRAIADADVILQGKPRNIYFYDPSNKKIAQADPLNGVRLID